MQKPVKDLVPGMEVGEDVIERDAMIIRKGTILSESLIQRLHDRGINRIAITGADDKAAEATPVMSRDEYEKKKSLIAGKFAKYRDDEQMVMLEKCMQEALEDQCYGR